jgi:glycosyltransferase involved in cell wall biosynthesis
VKDILSGRIPHIACINRWTAKSGYKKDMTVLVCQNLEHLTVPARERVLEELKSEMDIVPICLVTWRTGIHSETQTSISHPVDLKRLLTGNGLQVGFSGYAFDNPKKLRKDVLISVLINNNQSCEIDAEKLEKFRVVAIIAAFNEADILEASIRKLVNQGILVYVIDNWSTDSTNDILQGLHEKGLILGFERYPVNGPLDYLDWKGLLARKEELSGSIQADWFIHHDVDEVRVSPWRSKSLKEAIYIADRMGFNAIDHTQITFVPIDDGFKPDCDFEKYFLHYRPQMGRMSKINTWKKSGVRPNLTESGGHRVTFEGRRVFPFNFLIKHYPVRSQEHGERKIFSERQPRSIPEKNKLNWHVHYYKYAEGDSFISREQDLLAFDSSTFEEQYLVERLSGPGIIF